MDKEAVLEKAEADAEKTWHAFYSKEQEPPIEPPVEPKEDETPPVETPPVETPPEPPAEPPKVVEKPKDYEQMYRTLEGKYRAEVPRLNESLRISNEAISDLKSQIAALEARINDGIRSESPVSEDALAKLESEYPGIGKLFTTFQTGYEAKIAALEKQLNGRVSTEINTVKTDVASTKEQQFNTDMVNAGIPDWRSIDVDPGFHAWLQDIVPYTRFTKAEVLRDAGVRFDAATASQLFLDYKKSLEKPTQEPPKEEVPPVKSNLEQYIAPSTTTSGNAPVVSDRRSTYTRADYTRFMQESARGKFNPAKWGGKTEEQVELMFDTLATRGELQ